MSRAEKRLAKRVQKMRDMEVHDNPYVPYRRVTIKTKMYWPIELMREGKTYIIFQYIGIWALILLGISLTAFFLIRFVLQHLGWWHWV